MLVVLGLLGLLTASSADDGTEAGWTVGVSIAMLVLAGVWWTLTRNSAVPDLVDRLVPLGDGREVPGQVAPQPRSKLVAASIMGLLLGGACGAAAVATALDRQWTEAILAGIGAGIFIPLGVWRLAHLRTEEWVGFTTVGITIHGAIGHFTLPWTAIDDVGIHEMQHRGGRHRFFAIAGDIDRSTGTMGRLTRASARLGWAGWTLTLSGAGFDVTADDLLELARRWRGRADEPRWPDSHDAGST